MLSKRIATRVFVLGVAALALLPAMSGAQEPSATADGGTLTGRVVDKSNGRPLAVAQVLVLGHKWGTTSDEDGVYRIESLPAGTYDLNVMMMGYEDKTIRGIVIEPGRTQRVNFDMDQRIVAVLGTIDVVGKKKKIDKERTETSHNMDSQDLSDLPVDDVQEAIALQAGVIAKGGELMIRGGRAGEVQFQVDGVPVRDPLGGAGLSLASQALSSTETIVGGMSAKYGNAQSGIIIYNTKEGGDRFGGELRYTTDDYGSPSNTFDNYDRLFLGVGGPMPVENLTYYVSGELTYADDYPKTPERRSRRKLLNFVSVGDRKTNSRKMQGKLAYRPSPNTKLTFEMLDQATNRDNYFHQWSRAGWVQEFLDTTRTNEVVLRHGRWAPYQVDSTYHYYNAAEHTPDILDEFQQQKVVFRHTLGQSSHYVMRLSRQHFFVDQRVQNKQAWEYLGEREADLWFNYWDGESHDYFVISGDYPFLSTRETEVYQGIFDFTYQRGRHTFETGATMQYNDMRYFELQRPYNTNSRGEIGASRTRYHYYNPEGGAYVQDRWEHEGMVINAGLRYDFFSVGEQISISDVSERVKQQLSPRVGIAYPISDRDVFSFFYGRFYQVPNRTFLFDNLDSYDATRGNPNLTNETTVTYQASIQHLFNAYLVGQFSIYYRDMFGLIAAEATEDWSSTGDIWTYVNKDYASAKGFEVSLSRSYRNNYRWDLSYTYGVATGVASDPNAAQATNFVYLPNAEIPLNWDARHSIGASLYMGDRVNWGASLSWSFTSGYPYTPYQRDTREIEPEQENSRRLPSTTTLDVRADKYYRLWGQQLSLFLQGRNVLDAKNITNLTPGNWPPAPVNANYRVYYTETGRAGGAYLEDQDGDGVEEFIPLNDPRVFGSPRTIRVGIGFIF